MLLACGVAAQNPRGTPEVTNDMDEIHDDRQRDTALLGLLLQGSELGLVAIHERHPTLAALRIAPEPLIEGIADDLAR